MEQRGRADGGVAVTWQSVDEYLASLAQRGCSPDTVRAYRRCLASSTASCRGTSCSAGGRSNSGAGNCCRHIRRAR